MRTVVVANCSAFWGDDPAGARSQVDGGPIDYLVADYLVELTMAILHKQRLRNPDGGYARDFVTHLRDVLPACVERGVKVISNAGGVNPLACKAVIERVAAELGLTDQVRVGVLLGDALDDRLDELDVSDIRDRVRWFGVEVAPRVIDTVPGIFYPADQGLGGGATSLRADAQGKTYAQFLLATDVEIDAGLLDGLD